MHEEAAQQEELPIESMILPPISTEEVSLHDVRRH